MTVQRVAKDVFTIFTQSELLRCRRSVSYVAGPPVHQQKASLIDELTLLSRDEGLRWRLYEHLLCGHRVADLRALLSSLKRRGYSVPSHSARRADLLKAIVLTSEEAASTGGARPTVRGAPSSSCAGETCDVMVAFESSADPNIAYGKMRKMGQAAQESHVQTITQAQAPASEGGAARGDTVRRQPHYR